MDEMFTITKLMVGNGSISNTSGDQTDGYAGVPGYGVKTSAKFLDKMGYTWNSVLNAFIQKVSQKTMLC